MTRNLQAIRARLAARFVALAHQVERLEVSRREPVAADFAEQAVEREDDEARDSLEKVTVAEMARIRLAIARIDAGGYGICTACGEDIEEARLVAVPEAARCIACSDHIAGHA
ncbi:TraR/DksA family transcriptional regulator [Sphingopyxis fribergensis]|uniref:TraR/DksA family transcriptional regulator n=1 Tax=Sphingopyxis fribergensis TaxID=1515612 RepID=UPI0009DE16F2